MLGQVSRAQQPLGKTPLKVVRDRGAARVEQERCEIENGNLRARKAFALFARWPRDGRAPGEQDALQLIHDTMEKIQWNLLDASCKLAEALGPCEKFGDTKYADGLLPIDWYEKSVNKLVKPRYNMDWKGLRKRIKKYGLRHSTMSAIMPCESSSVIQNSTNGIEPVRSLLLYKKAIIIIIIFKIISWRICD